MYEMDVTYRAGKLHTNADVLSRLPNCQQCELKHENPVNRRYVKVLETDISSNSSKEPLEQEHMIMRVTSEAISPSNWAFKTDPELGVIVH
ncbi:unnamed protein product [Sphagnum jensenii]|uniref:Uncharacterized protein n=1 Tax=Sphagnum jensenii TaxID=128206 RepID=A0ABP0VI00_9BRYO